MIVYYDCDCIKIVYCVYDYVRVLTGTEATAAKTGATITAAKVRGANRFCHNA